MKKILFAVAVVLGLGHFAALAHESTDHPEKFPLSQSQREAIQQNKSPLILVLTADGQLLAADENGKTLRRCTSGTTKGGPGVEPCRGLQKDFAVQSLTTFSIIHSKKNPECITMVNPGNGILQEYCSDE